MSARAQRFDEIVKELRPKVRVHCPALTDEEVLEATVRMAAWRLADESFVWVEPCVKEQGDPPAAADR